MSSSTAGHIGLRFLTDSISPSLLLGYVIGFRKSYPNIRFTLASADAASIEADLIADKLQFGLIHALQNVDFLQSIDAGSLRTVAVTSPDYLERHGGQLATADDILKADLIDLDQSLPMARLWLGMAPDPAIQAALILPDEGAALDAAAMGGGVAFAPEPMARARTARGELVQLDAPLGNMALPLVFAYRKKNSRPLIESVFIEYLMDNKPI